MLSIALLCASSALAPSAGKPKVLFLTHTAGYEHEVVHRAAPEQLSFAEQTLTRVLEPEFELECSKDCARIEAGALAQYAAVVFHTTGALPLPAGGARALLDWVEAGGGFFGLHCATDTLYDSPEYMSLVGAAFDGHPWHQDVRVSVKDEPPVAFLKGQSFAIHDEIYQFRALPGPEFRRCLDLDMRSVDKSLGKLDPNPIAWWRPLGKGRMYYNSLGHGREAWSSPVFQQMLLEGVRFVAQPARSPEAPSGAASTGAAKQGATAAAPAATPADASAASAFAEAAALCTRDAGKLWGTSLCGPLLLVDPKTRRVWANQADARGQLQAQGPVWTGAIDPQLPLANTAVEWSGTRWSMLVLPLPSAALDRQVLLMHESFHRVQADLGLPVLDPACPQLDTRDGRYWLRLEMKALQHALTAGGDTKLPLLRDALLFRAARHARFPGTAAREAAQELHEGLAEYTGVVLHDPELKAQMGYQSATLGTREKAASLMRGFAYATGPAWALALDALKVEWRSRRAEIADLAYEVQLALEWTEPADPLAEAALRARFHQGDAVAADEDRRELQRKQREAAELQRYASGPRLLLPATSSARFAFDPNRVHALGELGTVYEYAKLSSAWGQLEAPGGALRRADEFWIVPAPADPAAAQLSGAGYTLALAPGWKLVPAERAGDYTLAQP